MPAVDMLKGLNTQAMGWLQHSGTFDATADFLIDALTIHSYFFFNENDTRALLAILTGPWAVSKFQQVLVGEDDTDPLQFVRLIIAFAEFSVKGIATKPGNVHVATLMQMMHGMLTAPGYPVVEDEMSPQTFEFWSSLVEHLLDSESEQDQTRISASLTEGKRHVFQAIQEYWAKIKIPPSAVADTWSKDSREGFTSFRKDFADLLETSYPLLHAPLFTKFVAHILNSLSARDWEASTQCFPLV